MYAANRSIKRPAIFILILASVVLAACGATGTTTNWPGLSTDGHSVFVAFGPEVVGYDVETQDQVFAYPQEPSAGLSFFAAPSFQDGKMVFGDFGAASGMFSPKRVVTLYSFASQDNEWERLWENSGVASGSIVAAPLQVGDQIFFGTADNYVYAIDADTGDPMWPEPFATEHSIWGSPAYQNGVVFISSLDANVYALDADTGQELWRRQLEGALASSPVANDDLIYVTSFDHHLYALGAGDGEVRWDFAAEDWIWGSPNYQDGIVYFADVRGNVFAVDGVSGEEIWSNALDKPVQSAPVVQDGSVFVGSEGNKETGQGLLTALAGADGGSVLWQTNTPAPLYATPVIVGSNIVVTVQHADVLLIAYDLATGKEEWRIAPPAAG